MEETLTEKFNEREDPMSREAKINLGICGVTGLGMVLLVVLTRMADRIMHFGLLHSPVTFMVALFFMACAVGVAGFFGYRRCNPYKAEAASKNSFWVRHSRWIRPLIAFTATALAVWLLVVCVKSFCVYNMPATFSTFSAGIMTPGQNGYVVSPAYVPQNTTVSNATQPTALNQTILNGPDGRNVTSSSTEEPGFFGNIWNKITGLVSSSPTNEATNSTQESTNVTYGPENISHKNVTSGAANITEQAAKSTQDASSINPENATGVRGESTAEVPEPRPPPIKEFPWPGAEYARPTKTEVDLWRKYLENKNVPVPEMPPSLAAYRSWWHSLNSLKNIHDKAKDDYIANKANSLGNVSEKTYAVEMGKAESGASKVARDAVYRELDTDPEHYARVLSYRIVNPRPPRHRIGQG